MWYIVNEMHDVQVYVSSIKRSIDGEVGIPERSHRLFSIYAVLIDTVHMTRESIS